MRIIARFSKTETARFVSHLDTQRVFQRAFRRGEIPTAYTNGFNPRPVLSFASALSVGATSSGEWLDVKLDEEMQPEEFMKKVNGKLPGGYVITEAHEVTHAKYPTLTAVMGAAEYDIKLVFYGETDGSRLQDALDKMLSGSIMVMRSTKTGPKNTDIRPWIYDLNIIKTEGSVCIIKLVGRLDAGGGLRPDLLLEAYKKVLGEEFSFSLHRAEIYSLDGAYMPKSRYTAAV